MKMAIVSAAVFLLGTLAGTSVSYAGDLKVGDRVDEPDAGQWYKAVIVAVDHTKTFPYRVHPLGYTEYADEWMMASQLKPAGSQKTLPIGGIANDPWLMKLTGFKQYHPTALYPGKYDCWTLSGTSASSYQEAAGILNFEIIDGRHYKDVSGRVWGYSFNPASGEVSFQGGLAGRHATYEQVSNPPTNAQPPQVTFANDVCQRHL